MLKLISAVPYAVWLLASIIVFAVGEFLSKKTALDPNVRTVAWTVSTYAVGTLLWLPALIKRNELAVVGAIWSVGGLMTTVLIGTLLFGEKLSWIGAGGIACGVVSIALLSLA